MHGVKALSDALLWDRMEVEMMVNLIGPCGMNCGICMAFLRKKNKCNGCRAMNDWNPKTIVECRIKNCQLLKENGYEYCTSCEEYPCKLIKHMDKRYRTRYGMSTIENLETIQSKGLTVLEAEQKEKWTCKECGGVINVHKGACSSCGKPRQSEE